MPWTINRGDLFLLDEAKVRAAVSRLLLTVPSAPELSRSRPPVDPRADYSHPFLVIQNQNMCGRREKAIGVALTTIREGHEARWGRGHKLIIEPVDMRVARPVRQGVDCSQVFTVPTDFFREAFGTVTPQAVERIARAVAASIGILAQR